MSPRVVVPSSLRELAGGAAAISVGDGAATVGRALERLGDLHPGLYHRIVTERGEVRPHVNLFVDGQDVRWTGGLETPVGEEGEVVILPSVSGG